MVEVIRRDAAKTARKYLADHGIKQSFVAQRLGIGEPTLTSRLNGRLKFDADFALAFAKVLEISPDIFLNKSSSKRKK